MEVCVYVVVGVFTGVIRCFVVFVDALCCGGLWVVDKMCVDMVYEGF